MGIRLIKDADDGELYILPDEKKSMKNAPQLLSISSISVADRLIHKVRGC